MNLLYGASLTLALAITAPAPADDAFTYSSYYPMQVGASWTYRVKDSDSKFTVTVKEHRNAGAQRWPCAHIVTSQDGKEVGSEDVSVQDSTTSDGKPYRGVFRVASDDKTIEPPVLILKLDKDKDEPIKNDTWTVNSKVDPKSAGTAQALTGTFAQTYSEDEDKKIAVGDKKYPAAIVACNDLDANAAKYTFKTYYVKDIGMAKQEITAGGLTVTLELDKDGYKAAAK